MKFTSFLAASLSILICGSASATTFGFSFLYDGDATPGGGTATKFSDLVEYGTGTVEVKDSAIVPGGVATFSSGAITAFNVKMTDNFGKTLNWDIFDDANNLGADDFGVRFDAAGGFERFDSPLWSFCSGCFGIYDDEYETSWRTSQGAYLMIVDEELRFGYLTEDVTRYGTDYKQGTIVSLNNFEGAGVKAFSNIFTAENSESQNFASGYILSTGPVLSTTPVPLPATLPLGLAAMGLLGLAGKRARQKSGRPLSAKS